MKAYASHSKKTAWFMPALLLLFCYGFYLLRFGYGYGSSDQDEFIPYLLRLLDPTLFENDWFVETQTSAFSVRTYFVFLLRALSFVFPVWLSVLLVYLISWSSIAIALFRLADLLTCNRLAALLGTALICIFTPFWTLGGNDVMHSMLVPSMAAWAIGLWAFVFYLRSLLVPAAVMAGLATILQALVGLQIMLLIGGLLCFKLFQADKPAGHIKTVIRTIASAGATYITVAAATLIPLFYQQFTSDVNTLSSALSSTLSVEPSLFYIMALFRNPHHYLFYSFDKVRLVLFFLLVLGGYLSLLHLQKNNRTFRADFVNQILIIVSGFCFIAFMGTEVMPLLLIAKLQLFKMTILIKILMVVVLSYWVVSILPGKLINWLDGLAFERPLMLSTVFIAGMITIILIQPNRFSQKVYPWAAHDSPQVRLAQWAQAHTKKQETFSIPPSWSSFRTFAQRAIVINHKAFPYRDEDIEVWYTRLTDMAPIKRPERTNATLLETLDLKYNTRSPHDLEVLSYEYGFDYVIRNVPLPGSSSFSIVHKEPGWYVYKVSPQRLAIQ